MQMSAVSIRGELVAPASCRLSGGSRLSVGGTDGHRRQGGATRVELTARVFRREAPRCPIQQVRRALP